MSFGREPTTRREEAPFSAINLFNQLHQEHESKEVKSIKKEIERYYRTGSEWKIPPTTLEYYKLIKVIGKGSFGKVYLGLQLLTNRLIGIKSLEKNSLKDRDVKAKILHEIDILKSANNGPGIANLLEVFENSQHVFLVMVYAKGGDLLRYLKSKSRLSEDEARPLFLKILIGICGLHAKNILHRDIKLDNILLDEHNNPMICDFGISRKMEKGEVINEQCGTPAYIAPEIILEKGYSGLKADIWSLGVMLYALLTGKMPFKGCTIEELHQSITTGNYRFASDYRLSHEAMDFICRMMEVSPDKRYSSFEALRDKWLRLNQREADEIQQKTLDNRVIVNKDIFTQLEVYGYKEKGINESLMNKKLNHASACYYNLYRSIDAN